MVSRDNVTDGLANSVCSSVNVYGSVGHDSKVYTVCHCRLVVSDMCRSILVHRHRARDHNIHGVVREQLDY